LTGAFIAAADVEVAIVGDDELEVLYRANDDDSEGDGERVDFMKNPGKNASPN